jgi:hypothetical protein
MPVIGASTNYEDPNYSRFSAPPLTLYAQQFAEESVPKDCEFIFFKSSSQRKVSCPFKHLCAEVAGIRRTESPNLVVYRGADKSLARPTSRCILFDGENIPFDTSLVIYIYI